jgi:hypothetical protein
LNEIRRLRLVEEPAKIIPPQWGIAQRFLVAGAVVMLLAGTAAAIIYSQFPSDAAIARFVQLNRKQVMVMAPWDAIVYYRNFVAPGIETPIDTHWQAGRERLEIGLIAALVALAAGAILAGVGVVGLLRRHTA